MHAFLTSLPQDKACALHAGNAIVIKEVVTSLSGLGVDLLPSALSTKATFACSCPEYQNRARDFGNVNLAPCKHLMGLVFVLAGRVDQRPTTILEMRGVRLPPLPHCNGAIGDSASHPIEL